MYNYYILRGNMTDKVKIKEVFTSIQGEGPFIGYKQLFIRFCGCNLSCNYCDTDYRTVDSKEYYLNELIEIVKNHSDCHYCTYCNSITFFICCVWLDSSFWRPSVFFTYSASPI